MHPPGLQVIIAYSKDFWIFISRAAEAAAQTETETGRRRLILRDERPKEFFPKISAAAIVVPPSIFEPHEGCFLLHAGSAVATSFPERERGNAYYTRVPPFSLSHTFLLFSPY